MAKTKLTTADKFYIEHHKDSMTMGDIANEIGKTLPQVRGYINSLPKENNSDGENEHNDHTGVMKMKTRNPLYARREKDGKVIATVMTAGASEEGDDARHDNTGKRYIDGAVIRIHDD